MEQKKKVSVQVISHKEIAPYIYDMWLETELSGMARPGQFLAVYPKDRSTLLPRPISICETDREQGRLRIVYRIAGQGTREFAGLRAGDSLDVLGTLGNGFPLDRAEGKRALLMGGGIGIPPLLQLAKELSGKKTVIAGYRDSSFFLRDDFERYGGFYAASEDGSAGTKGNVLDVVRENGLTGDIIYACGPMPMLRAVKQYAQEQGMEAYISLEERMACGVGACLGCVCRTVHKDAHSHVNNARICTDGPVFDAKEVEI